MNRVFRVLLVLACCVVAFRSCLAQSGNERLPEYENLRFAMVKRDRNGDLKFTLSTFEVLTIGQAFRGHRLKSVGRVGNRYEAVTEGRKIFRLYPLVPGAQR